MIDERLVIPGLAALKQDYIMFKCNINPSVIDRAIELLKGKDNQIHEMEIKLNNAYEANKVATVRIKKHEKTLRMLRETMEDMERGNASEEVSYLLRLMDKWESD